MSKRLERQKVIELRKQGKSYSEILKEIKVSKSSLSLWLKNIVLTEDQTRGIKMKKVRAVERYKKSMKEKRQSRLNDYYQNQVKKWIPLSNREKFLAGLFLYWGEGNKVSTNNVNISNTDPAVIKFAHYWICKCLLVSEDKIYINLHLYSDMDIAKETKYWSDALNIKTDRFLRPYIKKSYRSNIDQKGFGHGTCNISVYKTEIKENIMMAIRAISDNYTVDT